MKLGGSASTRFCGARLLRVPIWLSSIVTLALVAGALVVINGELGGQHFRQAMHALHTLPSGAVALALGLVFISYTCLTAGEAFATTLIGKQLPLGKVWRPSFTAYALSNALGFSLATGPAVRMQLYKGALRPSEIAAVSAITGASVFAAAAFAGGAGLIVAAQAMALHFGANALTWRILGAALVTPGIAWLALSLGPARRAVIGDVTAHRPGLRIALAQLAAGALDWVAAAGVLFVLLPEHQSWQFAEFVPVFVAAGMAGAVSGAPGGLGVFEAAILALAPSAQHAPGVMAALLAYRILYTLAPLGLAAAFLAQDFAKTARITRPGGHLREAAVTLAPRIFAALAFASGLLLMLSTATPAIAARLRFISGIAPLYVVEASHFLASITAVLLMVLAAGLWRRQRGAYVATLALLLLGAVFALLKGFDFEEALILGAVALALGPCRRAFNRKSRLLSEPLSFSWLAAILGAAAGACWLGFFAYRNVEYSNALWWTFMAHADVSRFLRGSAATATVIVVLSAWSLLAPPRSPYRGRPSREDLARARAAIASADTPHAEANLALLGDKDLLFSPSGQSFIMFRQHGARWIAMGGPCGLKCEQRALWWRFVELADEAGGSPVFYAIGQELLADVADLGLVARKIGETAIVRLADFTLEGKCRADLRAARNRFERAQASFEVLPPGAARAHAGELSAVSKAWLAQHSGAEKSFSLGRFDLDYMDTMPIAVVRQDATIVAFANIWTTPDKGELSIDLMRYSPDAQKGVMDFLFAKLLEWGKAEGYREFDLGLAPLAGLDAHRLAPAFARLAAAVFEGAEQVYGFRGLRGYRSKFDPDWRPLFLAARPSTMTTFALLDIALLTSGGWRGMMLGAPARLASYVSTALSGVAQQTPAPRR